MTDSGRKIHENHENPIDNYYITLAHKMSPAFHARSFTANDITSISAIFGVLCITGMYRRQYVAAGVFYILQYFFDCMDGNYARRYDQVSDFGDAYDHVKDLVVVVGVCALFVLRKQWMGLLIVAGLTLSFFHLGCQEVMYDREESPMLSMSKKVTLCIDRKSAERILPLSRWIGCGTWNTVLGLYMMTLK